MEIHHCLDYDRQRGDRARELRRDMTPQERKLWYMFLRKNPEKIYRQRIIGPFIADFYCAAAKLVIEVDGSQHYTEQGMAYDSERTAFLEAQGLMVLRFSNKQIDESFGAVCRVIKQTIENRKNGCRQTFKDAVL